MYLKNYMNIFLNIKAEDAHRLRQFLKKNPSTPSGSGIAREHLDAGIISRVVYSLEHALNELWESGSLMTYAKQVWKPYNTQCNTGEGRGASEVLIHHPTTQPMYILPFGLEQSFLDIGLYAKYGCT